MIVSVVRVILPYIISFISAFCVVYFALIIPKYYNTSFLLYDYKYIWCYAGLYGSFSCIFYFAFQCLGVSTSVAADITSNPYLQAYMVGIFIKGFLNTIPLATVFDYLLNSGRGTSAGVEMWFLSRIHLKEFYAVRSFVGVVQEDYTNLDIVVQKIEQNLPLDEPYKSIFISDLEGKIDDEDTDDLKICVAMEFYLRSFGKVAFNSIFPKKSHLDHLMDSPPTLDQR